ncbi:hypothetical protein QV06_03830 [Gallibacterium genomosp. 3]|uniref:HEAT repeat domain-containing protein n=1 Tax=Gallibacterium genomosp. 3 TaxID=505345 RepID=A0A1A7PTR7_9PAST|nr:HEAT repeat domain-containing protein [Gallibacterium genomosp. 3]OBX05117.1 hypothetical protein QV06_03830 [Gallibacterium genomosp. 3]
MIDLIKRFDEIKNTNSFKEHNKFINELLENENNEYYNIHYQFICDNSNDLLHERLCRAFTKRTVSACFFLLEKALDKNIKNSLLADIIQILGLMEFFQVIEYIPNFLLNNDELVRYKCIIVLGWLGKEKEISILSQILNSDEIEYLRGVSATAMRQIWYNYPDLKNKIIDCLYPRLLIEKSEMVNAMILISLQDILGKNIGVSENLHGEISGDINKSKIKLISLVKEIYHKA